MEQINSVFYFINEIFLIFYEIKIYILINNLNEFIGT
jgi:hypothetical protein